MMSITMVAADVLENTVALACRAPSYHNSQPWRWTADRDGLHLFLDPSRVVQTDHTGHQALISCGAVLDHLRVAMAAVGWRAHIDRFPNPNNLHHLASIDFSEMSLVTDGHRRRAEAIGTRRTDRLPFNPVAEWDSFETVLRSRIDDTVALVDVIADADRHELVNATELTDALRMYDSNYFPPKPARAFPTAPWCRQPKETGSMWDAVSRSASIPSGARRSPSIDPPSWWSPRMTTPGGTSWAAGRCCRRYCSKRPWPTSPPARLPI